MRGVGRQEYTITEVAHLTDYHPETLRYWVRVGELPGTQDQHHGDWVVDSSDLVSFLRGNGEAVPETIDGPR